MSLDDDRGGHDSDASDGDRGARGCFSLEGVIAYVANWIALVRLIRDEARRLFRNEREGKE